jgi:hypothetical protein
MDPTDLALRAAHAHLTRQSFAITAAESVPGKPGLYAIWGDEPAWHQLGLTFDDSTSLYIGKAERTLRGRDINTHFDAGSGTA